MKHKNQINRKSWLLLLSFLFYINAFAQVGPVIWEENFNTIDPDVWSFDNGDGCPTLCGWGNQELQWYQSQNAGIESVPGEAGNNALVIEARNEAAGGRAFTSAKLKTQGHLAVKYGMVEIRMRVPNLQTGLWPAAWMLGTGTGSWPGIGELDIMEMGHSAAERTRQGYPGSTVNNYVGSNAIFYAEGACSDQNPTCAASIAYDTEYATPYVAATPLNDRFVTYRMYWDESSIRYTIVDGGVEYDMYSAPFAITEESLEFQNPFYFILNLAVGGTFTDARSNGEVTAPMPAKMYVDYIRVHEWNGQGEVIFGSTAVLEPAGTFGVFTDETATVSKLTPGQNAEIYAWNPNLQEGTITPYEGSEVITWQHTVANEWFGGGVVPGQARNMTNYADGELTFWINIPANINFMVGVSDGSGNHFVAFPANTPAFGLNRTGGWEKATIPISEFNADLTDIQYMFMINSLDGAPLPSSTFQFAMDDILWKSGNVPDPVLTSVTVSPSSSTIDQNQTQQFTAQGFDQNGNPMAASVSWTATGGTINSSGLYTGTTAGSFTITATSGSISDDATVIVNSVNQGVTIPATIQAEDYTNMSGIQLEGTSDDGGGQNVGWIDTGDWLEYEINAPEAGEYTINYRVASQSAGGTIELIVNGVSQNTTSFDATGDWQQWIKVQSAVNLAAGPQTVRLVAKSSGWNINWLQFEEVTVSGVLVPAKIEAEAYTGMTGIQLEGTSDDGGGQNVGWIDSGDWLEYEIYAPEAGQYTVNYRVSSLNAGGAIDFSTHGVSQGITTFDATGDWQEWVTISTSVNLPAGNQIIRLTSNSSGWNINWIEFTNSGTPPNDEGCRIAINSDFSVNISDHATNPSLTFVPERTGVGSPTCILYYSTSPDGSYPGYLVTANTPYQINASAGQTIYYYYTYSLPEGGENNTLNNKKSFVTGQCNSGSAARMGSEETSVNEKDVIYAQLVLFPNPANDRLWIAGLPKEVTEIRIYDATGKKQVINKQINQQSISLDISSLVSGLHFVRIQTKNEVVTRSFIKK